MEIPELEAENVLATQSDTPAPAPVTLLPRLPAPRSSTAWTQGSTDSGSQQTQTHAAALQSDWSHISLLRLFYGIHMSRLECITNLCSH